MIITKLNGGLGNQLFQIASALSCAENLNTELSVDISEFEKNKQHGGYRLKNLNFPNFKIYTPSPKERKVGKLVNKLPILQYIFKGYTHEKGSEFNNIKNGKYLIGYWQNAENFHQIFTKLKSYITPISLSKKNEDMRNEIISRNSVSVHIRRGDYLSKETMKNHGVCSIEYYIKSFKKILSIEKNVKFYIFSNDIDWCKKNLKSYINNENTHFISNNSQEVDLWLMSHCKHSIIANSSFSWWGAYLAQHSGQIVIAPTPWYEIKQRSSSDPSLRNWHRLEK
jgi:hypothetical protein